MGDVSRYMYLSITKNQHEYYSQIRILQQFYDVNPDTYLSISSAFMKKHLELHLLFGSLFQICISGMCPRCLARYAMSLLKWKRVISGYMIREVFKIYLID